MSFFLPCFWFDRWVAPCASAQLSPASGKTCSVHVLLPSAVSLSSQNFQNMSPASLVVVSGPGSCPRMFLISSSRPAAYTSSWYLQTFRPSAPPP